MDANLHAALRRLARRSGIKDVTSTPEPDAWVKFLGRLSASFESSDRDRYLLERSLELSGQEMRELHETIALERDHLVLLLDTIPQAIFELDADFCVSFSNDQAQTSSMAERDDILGRSFWDVCKIEADPALDPDLVVRVLASGRSWEESDCTLTWRDGATIPANVTFHPQRSQEGASSVLVMIEDLTERKDREQAMMRARVDASASERAREAQAAFLANMSHELRTPLNTIIGYSELVWEEAHEQGLTSLTSDLDRIHTAGRHLLSLINDILDMSKIQSGALELELLEFGLGELLEDVSKTVGAQIAKTDNTLVLELEDPTLRVRSDPTRIRQSLINLIANAAKFTRSGTITLSQSVHRGSLLLRVRDTGIGIRPEVLPRLFDAFEQADASITRRFGGTGLGLSITKSICQALGGDIDVTSEVGVGTTFTIVLPLT